MGRCRDLVVQAIWACKNEQRQHGDSGYVVSISMHRFKKCQMNVWAYMCSYLCKNVFEVHVQDARVCSWACIFMHILSCICICCFFFLCVCVFVCLYVCRSACLQVCMHVQMYGWRFLKCLKFSKFQKFMWARCDRMTSGDPALGAISTPCGLQLTK